MTPYLQAKETAAALDAALCEAGAQSMATRVRLAHVMGIEAFNQMNMTPDAIKFHPEYIAARKVQNDAFTRLQSFNVVFVRTFKAELRADQRAKYLTKA